MSVSISSLLNSAASLPGAAQAQSGSPAHNWDSSDERDSPDEDIETEIIISTHAIISPGRKLSLTKRLSPILRRWLLENFELRKDMRIRKDLIYQSFLRFCDNEFDGSSTTSTNTNRLARACFGKVVRSLFGDNVKIRRYATNSRAHYYYVGLSVAPHAAQVSGLQAEVFYAQEPLAPSPPPTREGADEMDADADEQSSYAYQHNAHENYALGVSPPMQSTPLPPPHMLATHGNHTHQPSVAMATVEPAEFLAHYREHMDAFLRHACWGHFGDALHTMDHYWGHFALRPVALLHVLGQPGTAAELLRVDDDAWRSLSATFLVGTWTTPANGMSALVPAVEDRHPEQAAALRRFAEELVVRHDDVMRRVVEAVTNQAGLAAANHVRRSYVDCKQAALEKNAYRPLIEAAAMGAVWHQAREALVADAGQKRALEERLNAMLGAVTKASVDTSNTGDRFNIIDKELVRSLVDLVTIGASMSTSAQSMTGADTWGGWLRWLVDRSSIFAESRFAAKSRDPMQGLAVGVSEWFRRTSVVSAELLADRRNDHQGSSIMLGVGRGKGPYDLLQPLLTWVSLRLLSWTSRTHR